MKEHSANIWSAAYQLDLPIRAVLQNGIAITCNKVVRAIPGRRYVCRGNYDNKPAFIKLFAMTTQAKREWENEWQGIEILKSKGILAPGILHTETSPCLSSHVIVYSEIEDAESARQRWEQGNKTARRLLMQQLVTLIARHHAAGLRQKDCHLLNFVFSHDALYTLDATDIEHRAAALSRQASMQGLADLLALFPVEQDEWLPSLYKHYWQTRNTSADANELEKLQRDVIALRDHKLRKYLDKTYRDCSAFSVQKTWTRFSSIVREYNNATMQLLLSDPDIETGTIKRRLVKDGNTCTVSLLETAQQTLVCKRYNIKNSWHALMRAFRTSRASKSWRNAHRLIKFDIATPAPIALVEKRFGFIRRQAWFFMQHVDGMNAYDVFHGSEYTLQQLQGVAQQFVSVFEKMIQARLSHGDMKITNFIFSDDKLFVIDLDSMQQHNNNAAFSDAFRVDMARFMRNWKELPEIKAIFTEYLSHSLAAQYLPNDIKS